MGDINWMCCCHWLGHSDLFKLLSFKGSWSIGQFPYYYVARSQSVITHTSASYFSFFLSFLSLFYCSPFYCIFFQYSLCCSFSSPTLSNSAFCLISNFSAPLSASHAFSFRLHTVHIQPLSLSSFPGNQVTIKTSLAQVSSYA